VYVVLLLIPRKKQNLTTQNTICRGNDIGCGRINTTKSSCVLCFEILVFFLICFYTNYLQCYTSHLKVIGGLRQQVSCCSAALPRCNRLHLQGIERVLMLLFEGNGDEMTILMIQTRMLVFVYVKCTFSLVWLFLNNFKSLTGPRLLFHSTALHCSAGCRPTPTTKNCTRCGGGWVWCQKPCPG
jgi:hypothetical protein